MADDERSRWVEAHVMLPEQMTPRRPLDPERRLMLAVLQEAVATYLAGGQRSVRANVLEIEQWFASETRAGRIRSATSAMRSASIARRSGARIFLQRLERLAS
jgi:hypothetical protein